MWKIRLLMAAVGCCVPRCCWQRCHKAVLLVLCCTHVYWVDFWHPRKGLKHLVKHCSYTCAAVPAVVCIFHVKWVPLPTAQDKSRFQGKFRAVWRCIFTVEILQTNFTNKRVRVCLFFWKQRQMSGGFGNRHALCFLVAFRGEFVE